MYGQLLTPVVMRILKVLAILVALVAGGMYIHHQGYKAGYSEAESKGKIEMQSYKDAQQKLIDAVAAEKLRVETDLQTKLLQSVAEKENEIKAINTTHERLLIGLRARPSRPTPAPATITSPTITTYECTRAAGDGEGLSREDGEFLVGEAASADILRQALKQCREAYQRLLLEPIEKH